MACALLYPISEGGAHAYKASENYVGYTWIHALVSGLRRADRFRVG